MTSRKDTPASSGSTDPHVVPDGHVASDSSKLKTLMNILKQTLGVKDLASLCPNLEYWNYQDRADFFVSIGDFEDPMDRMLATVRFTISTELKFAGGRVCKPYNSILGEHFRCHWDARALKRDGGRDVLPQAALETPTPTPLPLFASGAADVPQQDGPMRVVYLTEQVSHHPPVSSYYYGCPAAGIYMVGVDQLSARFTGTSVRIYPGSMNKGMFVHLCPGVRTQSASGEQYRITHPTGAIFGLFRGSFWPAVTDVATVTCTPAPGSASEPLRALIEYKEEGWLSRPKHAVEGCIYRYEPGGPSESYRSMREVPKDCIRAHLQGNWRGLVTWRRPGEDTAQPLVNMADLALYPREVRPVASQDPYESHRVWESVTNAITGRDYGRATREKQAIEQEQREIASRREKAGTSYVPRFFVSGLDNGQPQLTPEGCAAVEGELRLDGYAGD
ncbi:hypothetical protein MSPP1_004148 [Malassezia sp. CBS 17886]|nr:hypothetical protein MSPP1_004148 [Malassezia sp. CBS 17886]